MHRTEGAVEPPSAAALARFSLEAQHPLTRRWAGDELRLQLLASEHAFDLQLATDLELAARRAEFLSVGQPPEAFLNRWVSVSPDLQAMLSIRFEGLNRHRPFVDASVLSRPPSTLDFPTLMQAARKTYGPFRPLYLRLWSAAPAGAFPQAQPDKRFLAAPITELRGRSVPPELTLSPTWDLSRYGQAQAAYDAVDARHPAHAEQAALQNREELQDSIEAGTLFDVRVGGEWAGYVGATQDCEGGALGLPAYVVQELILSAPFRGRGYGAALTTLLARALPDPARVLLGTIHAENRGAITAAQRSGRVDVGGWWQLGLE